MPVIDELGLSVRVLVGGAPAVEYEDRSSSTPPPRENNFTKTIHRYIEAVDDSEFSLLFKIEDRSKECYRFGGSNAIIVFYVYVDNHYCDCRLLRLPYPPYETTLKGHEQTFPGRSDGLFRNFKFTAVKSGDDRVDDDVLKRQTKEAKNLGRIKVVVRRATTTGVFQPPIASHASPSSVSGEPFSEKAFKGKSISHGTSFSAPVSKAIESRVTCANYDADPLATFYFYYRSKRALQAECIIPRSPTRSLSIDGLSSEEIQRLARERLRDMKGDRSGSRRPKRELDDAAEQQRRPLKILKGDDGRETVDLTDD